MGNMTYWVLFEQRGPTWQLSKRAGRNQNRGDETYALQAEITIV